MTWGQLKCIAEKNGAKDDTQVFSINVVDCSPEEIAAGVFEHGLVINSILEEI
jgi:hypothetical protein